MSQTNSHPCWDYPLYFPDHLYHYQYYYHDRFHWRLHCCCCHSQNHFCCFCSSLAAFLDPETAPGLLHCLGCLHAIKQAFLAIQKKMLLSTQQSRQLTRPLAEWRLAAGQEVHNVMSVLFHKHANTAVSEHDMVGPCPDLSRACSGRA